MNYSLIIPAMNEEENLKNILPKIDQHLVDEIILVDGKSKDNTIEVARELIPDIKVHIQTSKGKGAAMKEAAKIAKGEYLIYMDADGSMHPSEIRLIIRAFQSGYDFVKGTRNAYGGKSYDITPFRDFGNNFFTYLTNALYNTSYTDLCYGYFGIKRSYFIQMNSKEKHFGIEAEVAIKAAKLNFPSIEYPSIEYPRLHGSSNLNSIKDGWSILLTILKNRIRLKYLLIYEEMLAQYNRTRQKISTTITNGLVVNQKNGNGYHTKNNRPKIKQRIQTYKRNEDHE